MITGLGPWAHIFNASFGGATVALRQIPGIVNARPAPGDDKATDVSRRSSGGVSEPGQDERGSVRQEVGQDQDDGHACSGRGN